MQRIIQNGAGELNSITSDRVQVNFQEERMMADRHEMERRWRDWDREERIRRERRGPQGFAQEDWGQSRRWQRPVRNPLEDQDDYSMRHREGWEGEPDRGWESDRDRWMDYGHDYEPRQDWGQRRGRYREESPWEDRYDERDFLHQDYDRPEGRGRMRDHSQRGWSDYEMDYGRGVYDQRRGSSERQGRRWDEGRRQPGWRGSEGYGRRDDRGYGDIRGRGYGWEGGYMDPYNRGVVRRDEGYYPEYLDRYDEPDFDDEDLEGDYTYSYSEFWLVPGPFSGIGPRGYQRSDDRIFEDVCSRMSTHGQLDPSEIDVKVENGEVTLEGKVDDRFSKRLAEDIAESVSGVTDVHNRIRVGEREGQNQLEMRAGDREQISTRSEDREE